jgi:hypothetical protein
MKSLLLRPSVFAIIAANQLPLLGVLFWGWSVFALLLLFWPENVIIGFFQDPGECYG